MDRTIIDSSRFILFVELPHRSANMTSGLCKAGNFYPEARRKFRHMAHVSHLFHTVHGDEGREEIYQTFDNFL